MKAGLVVPAPIAGCVGFVGGIESITVAGTRWYFGFNHSGDIVVSPLIDDPDVMAQFASRHMIQTGGKKKPAVWRQLVDASVAYSDLVDDPKSRDFTTAVLSKIATDLDKAKSSRKAIPKFEFPTHVRYLLGASCGWEVYAKDKQAIATLGKLGLDRGIALAGVAELATSWIRGKKTLPSGASITDAAQAIQEFIDRVLRIAPANWGTTFAALKPT